MSPERFPDIEVYAKGIDTPALINWLSNTLHASMAPAGPQRWRGEGQGAQGASVPCLLLEKVADGFTSLTFASDATPWPRDIDCARALHAALGGEVRCSPGGWLPGDAPEQYLRLCDGEETIITWS